MRLDDNTSYTANTAVNPYSEVYALCGDFHAAASPCDNLYTFTPSHRALLSHTLPSIGLHITCNRLLDIYYIKLSVYKEKSAQTGVEGLFCIVYMYILQHTLEENCLPEKLSSQSSDPLNCVS